MVAAGESTRSTAVDPPRTVPGVLVREETTADHEQIRAVHLAAFGDDGTKVADLLDGLRADSTAANRLSLVAVDGDDVVGNVMFTRGLLDAPARLVEVRVLSPVGVLPHCQRRGIGSELVRTGLSILAEQGVPLVFLEGSPTYYSRLGFVPAAALGFRKPSLRIPDPGFQVATLPAYEKWMTGTLVYPQTFWDHDAVGLRAD
jgi:putative acetyltransferase